MKVSFKDNQIHFYWEIYSCESYFIFISHLEEIGLDYKRYGTKISINPSQFQSIANFEQTLGIKQEDYEGSGNNHRHQIWQAPVNHRSLIEQAINRALIDKPER